MTDTARLRAAVSGLVAFAAEEETVLLAVAALKPAAAGDGPVRWRR